MLFAFFGDESGRAGGRVIRYCCCWCCWCCWCHEAAGLDGCGAAARALCVGKLSSRSIVIRRQTWLRETSVSASVHVCVCVCVVT